MGATPVILTLRQKDLKFDASLGYTASACLKKQNNNKLARPLKDQPKAAAELVPLAPQPPGNRASTENWFPSALLNEILQTLGAFSSLA